MAYDLTAVLVVGISSRALFNLEDENALFEREGISAYTSYQLENIDNPPQQGTGFRLVQNLLSLT